MLGDGHIDRTRLDVVNIRTGGVEGNDLDLAGLACLADTRAGTQRIGSSLRALLHGDAEGVGRQTRHLSNGQFVLRLSGGGQGEAQRKRRENRSVS